MEIVTTPIPAIAPPPPIRCAECGRSFTRDEAPLSWDLDAALCRQCWETPRPEAPRQLPTLRQDHGEGEG